MILRISTANNEAKNLFWDSYCCSMRPHIEQIWGWDEKWQLNDFEIRWEECDNKIIHKDNQVIGYVQAKYDEREYYIMMFIIFPEHRSSGIGSRILANLETLIKVNCISLRVFRTNIRALKFYRSQGFVDIQDEGDFHLLKKNVYNK